MNYPAASCGVSQDRHGEYPKASLPNVTIGVQFRIRLDSRLKHAGMTVFGKKTSSMQQMALKLMEQTFFDVASAADISAIWSGR